MRFDDMIATVLAQPAARAAARAAKWRQLVDLLAQRHATRAGQQISDAFDFLRAHRSDVAFGTRREVGRALAGRSISPDLLAFFTEDDPAVTAPLIAGARLLPDEWLNLLPTMTATGRALLRHRRDLDPEVAHALAAFGSSDFVITGTIDAAPKRRRAEAPLNPGVESGEAQIRDLVARIEAFRKHRIAAVHVVPVDLGAIDSFRWESGPDGTIIWIADAPRGPLIGQTIAATAERGEHGVDGQAAGAFEKRAPFRDARFSVAGGGTASGDWRISGVPFFDPQQGNFLGYRGAARRPRIDEVARAEPGKRGEGLFGTDLPADSLRQLIHELRTPLNAIVGFAELIDGQYLGPAGASYRARAFEIVSQANKLLLAVDDLDTAARVETSQLTLDDSAIDAVALLYRLHDAYERVATQRNSSITIDITPDLPAVRVEMSTAERMFARMLAATIGLARDGETIAASMALAPLAGQAMLCLAIDRPHAIAGLDEDALLDPGYSPEGDWPGAPALGLGFALRLVRNLAEAVGGALIVGDARFFLYLPTVEPAELSSGQGS